MDTSFCEEYEIPQSDVGMRVTSFCPLCKAQVFGFLFKAVIDDLVDHMNCMHKRGRSGRA
jgi:hypothetical protein